MKILKYKRLRITLFVVLFGIMGLSMSSGEKANTGEVKVNKTKSKFAELPATNFGYNMWASTRKSYMTMANGKYIYVYAHTNGYIYILNTTINLLNGYFQKR